MARAEPQRKGRARPPAGKLGAERADISTQKGRGEYSRRPTQEPGDVARARAARQDLPEPQRIDGERRAGAQNRILARFLRAAPAGGRWSLGLFGVDEEIGEAP